MNNNSVLNDALTGGGSKSAFTKETPVGTSITGTILEVSVQQLRDFANGKPKFWDNDRPQLQIVITIQTTLKEDPEDDGIRSIYIKTWGVWKQALMEAVKAAGGRQAADVLVPGAVFTDTFTGTKPSTQGSDTKVHAYKITPAQSSLDDALGGTVNTTTGEITPPPAAAPQPSAVPAAQAAPAPAAADPVDVARQLIAINLPDSVIQDQTGLSATVIAALRNAA
ncbi:hypothetical protein [Acaricomes phytoseiuli]|uniref:hypothetical protein n=1 Tax=Acaricomes phytoseiuli TaxID=291968 RepID=UPI00035DE6EC|nr:hypothetical protein [Acaricomes phytoseiuli]